MKIERSKLLTLSYVEEGLISSENVGEGRMIPALVLDVGDNSDIKDLIKSHLSIDSGDASMCWIQDFYDRRFFILRIKFLKPMQIIFGIRFNIATDYSLIDGIIQSKGLYIKTGQKGDKISKSLDSDMILIEVPDTGVKRIWDEMLLNTLIKDFKKRKYSRKESKDMALNHISKMREMWKVRRLKE